MDKPEIWRGRGREGGRWGASSQYTANFASGHHFGALMPRVREKEGEREREERRGEVVTEAGFRDRRIERLKKKKEAWLDQKKKEQRDWRENGWKREDDWRKGNDWGRENDDLRRENDWRREDDWGREDDWRREDDWGREEKAREEGELGEREWGNDEREMGKEKREGGFWGWLFGD